MIYSYMNLEATSLEQVSTGSASAHLVTYSAAVTIYLAPVIFVGTWSYEVDGPNFECQTWVY